MNLVWIGLSKDNKKIYAIGYRDSNEAGLSVIYISSLNLGKRLNKIVLLETEK